MKKLFLAVLAILLVNCASTAPVTQPLTQTAQVQVPCPTASAVPFVTSEAPKPVAASIPGTDTFKVKLTCDLKAAIAAGKYDQVAEGFTKTEPLPVDCKDNQEVEVRLFHNNRAVYAGQQIQYLDQLGWRPATWPELFALGATYPQLQSKIGIVGLGSTWIVDYLDDDSETAHMPVLHSNGGKRALAFEQFQMRLDPNFWYAVVKSEPNSRKLPSGKLTENTYTVRTLCHFPDALLAGKYGNLTYNGEFQPTPNWESLPNEGCKEKQSVEIGLFYFEKLGSMEDTIAEMDRQGWRPATWPELLALGAKYPDLQRRNSIYAYGTQWVREGLSERFGNVLTRSVPTLYESTLYSKATRSLVFWAPAEFVGNWSSKGWNFHQVPLFAAVRKPTSKPASK